MLFKYQEDTTRMWNCWESCKEAWAFSVVIRVGEQYLLLLKAATFNAFIVYQYAGIESAWIKIFISSCQLFASVCLVSGYCNFCVLLSAAWRKFSKQTQASCMLRTLPMEEHPCTGQKLLRWTIFPCIFCLHDGHHLFTEKLKSVALVWQQC